MATEVKVKKILSIEEMLAPQDTSFVEVLAWGGVVRLGSLDAGEVLEFHESNKGPARKTAGLRLLIKSLVDASGTRIGKAEHLDAFKKRDGKTIGKLTDAILKLNDMRGTDTVIDLVERVKHVDGDPSRVEKLAADLHKLADDIAAAGTDEKALLAALERNSDAVIARADAKNG